MKRVAVLIALALVASVAGCGFPELPRLQPKDAAPDGDAGGDAAMDAGVDTPDGICQNTMCGSSCVDTLTDEMNCGGCFGAGGTQCTGNDKCCNGVCADTTSSAGNCGACATEGGTVCSGANNTCCNGVCTNTMTDSNHCGMCAGLGAMCSSLEACCGGSCDDITTKQQCGACGVPCNGTDTCQVPQSGSPMCCPAGETNCNGQCVNLATDESNCGTCFTACNIAQGQTCTAPSSGSGTSVCCPADQLNCNGLCIDPMTNNANCGGCAGVGGTTCTGAEVCTDGHCCVPGLTWCNGTCVDLDDDHDNCGSCSHSCGGAGVCTSGQCDCSFGATEACGTDTCELTSVNPAKCGVNCENCGGNVCVSGECKVSCPTGLVARDAVVGDALQFRHCVNPDSDSLHCGAGNIQCASGSGCSHGTCVSLAINPPPTTPAKCALGGPPISVPMLPGGMSQICTGSIAAGAFLFGLCTRQGVALARDLTLDAFDSTLAPYSSCTTDSECSGGKMRCRVSKRVCTGAQGDCPGDVCEYPIKCVGDITTGKSCAGGGVATNGRDDTGTTSMTMFSNTGKTTVGGDFWGFGTVGMDVKGETYIKQRLLNAGPYRVNSKPTHVFGDAYIKGPLSFGANGHLTIDGVFTYDQASCASLPAGQVTVNCTTGTFPSFSEPCGAFDNTDRSKLPIADVIVERIVANNDNSMIGLAINALDSPAGARHLDLPCGVYYLNSIRGSSDVTIAVHGRAVLVVAGAIDTAAKLTIDVDPTASLDLFVGGVMRISGLGTIGSPLYPRRTRVYVGSASCGAAGCSKNADCCSGLCNVSTCVGGSSSISGAVSVGQSFNFNALLWSGHGLFSHSSPLEIYGALYTNVYDAGGAMIIHHDDGAALLGDECPSRTGQACKSCRECNGQACNGMVCGACGSDADCCAPLRCVTGTCTY